MTKLEALTAALKTARQASNEAYGSAIESISILIWAAPGYTEKQQIEEAIAMLEEAAKISATAIEELRLAL